ncbi:30S ribosomal protein S8 [Candidatus Peregrinibacteria bacterium CG10_big_fil_rev_8_21_14_0_10_36_19]|nr:MAG: 30S ribosomal protein S8 [Candidatus Peregrinibacteria bacterium CG10_big_fil_rev_8_21_14_0_10_36_19]
MHTDPIADLLTRIRNASRAHHQTVTVPYSTIKENILKVMKSKGVIEDFKIEKGESFKIIEVVLKEDRSDVTLKRVSKPGQRIYVKSDELKSIKSGLGFRILSTPKGIMCNYDAKKQKLGGEVICEIF